VKLLLDEMHAPSIAESLKANGWDVIAVAAEPGLRGLPDAELMLYASHNRRAIVTENVADFSILANGWTTKGENHAGIVFTNPSRFDRASLAYPSNLIRALDALLGKATDRGSSWVHWL
jgi:hypothetical protein